MSTGLRAGAVVKDPPSVQKLQRRKRHGLHLWVRKIAWSQKWQPTPVSLPGKFQEQRSLVGCSPWGHKELAAHTHIHTQNHHLVNFALKMMQREKRRKQRNRTMTVSTLRNRERVCPFSTLLSFLIVCQVCVFLIINKPVLQKDRFPGELSFLLLLL